VGARYWGPGRFRKALRDAVADGDVKRLSRDRYGPAATPEPEPDQEPAQSSRGGI
jgi:hypothetical protein